MSSRFIAGCAAVAAAACLTVSSCTDVQVVSAPPSGSPGSYAGNVVGRVEPAASGARVVAEQAAAVDSTLVDPATGAFTLVGLAPGTYDIVIRARDYRIERLERVAVYAGSVTYIGAIRLSTTPDLVRSFAPADRAEVPMDSYYRRLSIGIDFEVPMDRASVQAAFRTEPPVRGVFYWSQVPAANPGDFTGGRETDVAPPGYQELPGGEITTYRNIRSMRFLLRESDTFVDSVYVVHLSAAAHDSSGEAMRFPLRFSFRTIQTSVSQTTIETQPEDGATGVSLLGFSSVRISFPRRMDRASVESALSMTPPTSPIFLWTSDSHLILYTGGPLRAETTYRVRIADTARDRDGVRLPEPFEFSFTTEAVAVRSTSPSNGQVFVDYSTNLRVYLSFNTYIVRSSYEAAWSIVPAANGYFEWEDNTRVYFRPTTPLVPNALYTITFGPALRDLHGTGLPQPFSFAFVTRPQ